MIEVVSEYVVNPEHAGRFELAYGPGGAWSNLLADAPGFRGASIMRDEQRPDRYLTVEVWDSPAQRESALSERQIGYVRLLRDMESWSESIHELGTFRMLAEASIRPRAGRTRRGGRQPRR